VKEISPVTNTLPPLKAVIKRNSGVLQWYYCVGNRLRNKATGANMGQHWGHFNNMKKKNRAVTAFPELIRLNHGHQTPKP
jgi:hypothetical protein